MAASSRSRDDEEAKGLTSNQYLNNRDADIQDSRENRATFIKFSLLVLFIFVAFAAIIRGNAKTTIFAPSSGGMEEDTSNDQEYEDAEEPSELLQPELPKEDVDDSSFSESEGNKDKGNDEGESEGEGGNEKEEENEGAVATSEVKVDEDSFLNEVKCIPKVCRKVKRFVSKPSQLANPKAWYYLASFPGSGNTWSRSIVEQGTRRWTGSVYTDSTLKKEGFQGELVEPFRGSFPKFSAIKTHFPYFRKPHLSGKVHYVVIVLRSPFDALLSEFNREYSHGGDPHTSTASLGYMRQVLPNWFKKRGQLWYGFMKFWMGERFWENGESHLNASKGVHSFEIQKVMPSQEAENKSTPMQVLFYEDFIHHFGETSHRMFSFLHEGLGDVMPDPETATVCAVKNHEQESVSHRHHSGKYNPFLDPKGGIVKHNLVAEFCEHVKEYWFTEKWGECNKAYLQSYRGLPIYRSKGLPTSIQCEEDDSAR